MEDLLLLLMASAGLTLILTKSALFKGIREFLTLNFHKQIRLKELNHHWYFLYQLSWFFYSIFTCSLCMGVWASAFCFLLFLIKWEIILFALAGAFIAHTFDVIIKNLERK